jgi:hypothetical protein
MDRYPLHFSFASIRLIRGQPSLLALSVSSAPAALEL